jgi:hypothetical protein
MALAPGKRRRDTPEFFHAQVPAMNLARGFHPKFSAASNHEKALRGDAPQPCRRTLLTVGDAEMAEQVVSDAIVQECVLRCGSPWRGCGIPADDLCLLAMRGAARPAVLSLAAPGGPSTEPAMPHLGRTTCLTSKAASILASWPG